MKLVFCFAFLYAACAGNAMDPSAALKRLMEGNLRYTKDRSLNPDRNACRRLEVLNKQNPYATILGCSDSRVPPEIIFDEGIGDLFTIRVAGNVAGPLELDSIEYSARIGSSLIVVLGHQSCGAVTAVLNNQVDDIEEIAQLIQPAIQDIKPDHLIEAVKANVQWVVDHLKKTPLLQKLIEERKIEIVGAYYHLGSGKVELLPLHK